MMGAGDLRSTDAVEVKHWRFPVGPTGRRRKVSTALEVTVILDGRMEADLDGHDVILEAGDYVVIPRGVPNNTVVNVTDAAEGLTIKAPSDLNNKTEL